MSFRKKGVRVTVELLDDVLEEVKLTFDRSLAPAYLKKKLKHLKINWHIVRRPSWYMYGQAWAVGKWAKKDIAKRQLKLKESTHPTVTLDGDIYFLVIQVNKGSFRGITRRGLRYLVAHELAHILQIVVDEEVDSGYSYSTDADHDEKWIKYTKWMGGTGTEFIDNSQIWV